VIEIPDLTNPTSGTTSAFSTLVGRTPRTPPQSRVPRPILPRPGFSAIHPETGICGVVVVPFEGKVGGGASGRGSGGGVGVEGKGGGGGGWEWGLVDQADGEYGRVLGFVAVWFIGIGYDM
jgi:hypothetical protein